MPLARSILLGSVFSSLAASVTSPLPPQAAKKVKHAPPAPIATYEVVNKYPHSRAAFTQGLVYHDGHLYESTGMNGQSSLRKVELRTGRVVRSIAVPDEYFAEGVAILSGKIFQLTWLSKLGFIYDLDTFRLAGEFGYDWEGWGLTHDDKHLIISDGSNTLRFVDPSTFRLQKTLEVHYNGAPLRNLNELEYIDGQIYSNIWHSSSIARIDPASGRVLEMIDLGGLESGLGLGSEDVLNGIAYDAASKRIFVTGKRWPFVFEIRVKPRGS